MSKGKCWSLALAGVLITGMADGVIAKPPPLAVAAPALRDGSHDFDWEIGRWTTRLRYLPEPLTGSTHWLDYHGTSDVRAVLGGRANLVELSVEGKAGRIEGAALRLYNPKAHQWTLNFASIRNGQLTAPVHGAFDANGRGLFYGMDTLDGRAVLVRFVISDVTHNSARFEQAYSADAGASWEVNWIAVDTQRPIPRDAQRHARSRVAPWNRLGPEGG